MHWTVKSDVYLAEVTGVEYAPSHVPPDLAVLYLPIALLPPLQHTPPAHKRPRLAAGTGTDVAERLRHESLRDLAVAYDVSHETIRKVADRAWRERLASF